MVDPELLKILVCTATRAPLEHVEDETGEWLVSTGNGYRYPVRDGIPVMLIDEAQKPDAADP